MFFKAGNLSKQIFIMHKDLPEGSSVQMKRVSPDRAVQCLIAADKDDLVAVDISPPYDDTFYTDAAAPTVDGVELSAPLAVLARTSIPADVNVLGGSNLDEGTEFIAATPPIACNANASDLLRWPVTTLSHLPLPPSTIVAPRPFALRLCLRTLV